VYDQALSVFLCAPQALYAVNRHVAFDTASLPARVRSGFVVVRLFHHGRRCLRMSRKDR
jgi:hypothetical protein